jgi:hypothetical protein
MVIGYGYKWKSTNIRIKSFEWQSIEYIFRGWVYKIWWPIKKNKYSIGGS